MKPLVKITLINFAIFVVYSLLMTQIRLPGDELELGALFIWTGLIILQSLSNLFIGVYYFNRNNKEKGAAFTINVFVIPLIGYGVCTLGQKL